MKLKSSSTNNEATAIRADGRVLSKPNMTLDVFTGKLDLLGKEEHHVMQQDIVLFGSSFDGIQKYDVTNPVCSPFVTNSKKLVKRF